LKRKRMMPKLYQISVEKLCPNCIKQKATRYF
jgi:hypothetical protein